MNLINSLDFDQYVVVDHNRVFVALSGFDVSVNTADNPTVDERSHRSNIDYPSPQTRAFHQVFESFDVRHIYLGEISSIIKVYTVRQAFDD